ncbi:tryptophan transporter [Clostridium thermobutyricum]|uniref:Putative tryptophan transport protein n=1 Tax=Clostridium thermobutyricum DSM 4928 TaxID=1121339 RepID=A0A1V4SV04_9CLOT|nr:tryptophan transporter [Clostridium thermobutyricum]OPX47747.1 putative tryptophan transport protein [Clostridium thermobutyricum DSM 4928]
MRDSKTKKMIINALMLGIGAILHQITPALGLPMQPDFALAMLFIIIILNNGGYKTSLVCGIITGIFTALTTKFPGGQVPNMIDKIITVHVVVFIIYGLNKLKIMKSLEEKKRMTIMCGIVLGIGTLISGLTFIYSANLIVGLPAPFIALFNTVVLPAVLINLVAGIILFKIVQTSIKRAII